MPALAEANLFDTINSLFSRVDNLARPEELVPALEKMSVVWAVVFLIAGLVCLLNGYKLYKWVTIVLALTIGASAGYYLGKQINAGYIVAACVGALLAVACWPLMKYAVAIMGGLAGAFMGANLWGGTAGVVSSEASGHVASTYWVGALMGLILCGMLSFILFKAAVVTFTSVSGATIALIGALGLIMQVPAWRDGISEWAAGERSRQVILPMLVLVPAIIGLVLQQTRRESGGSGNSVKPAAKPAAA